MVLKLEASYTWYTWYYAVVLVYFSVVLRSCTEKRLCTAA